MAMHLRVLAIRAPQSRFPKLRVESSNDLLEKTVFVCIFSRINILNVSFLSSLASMLKSSSSTANPYGAVMGVKMPTFSLGDKGLFGFEEVEGLGGIAKSISESAENLIQGARLVGCAGTLLTNPDALFQSLNMIAGSALGVAGMMGDRIMTAIQNQINLATGQIAGSVADTILTIFSLFSAIYSLYDAIINLYDYLASLSFKDEEFWLSKEECAQMFGFIGMCLMNKMFGSKTESFTNSVVAKVDEYGSEVNAKISEELKDVTVVNNYIKNQTFMLNKATKQLNGFRL